MAEQNPSQPVGEGTIVVSGSRPDAWWQDGPLRLGHWVSVTVYRFPDMRNPASQGGALPLGGKGDNSAREYGVQGEFGRKVYTFRADGDAFEPGAWGNPQFVGPIKSVRTSKAMGQGSGTFTVVAKPFAEWAPLTPEESVESTEPAHTDASIVKYVDSGDWIEIVVYKADPRLPASLGAVRTLLVGKVDSVSLEISPSLPGGKGGSTVRIEGRDVGSVYEDTLIYFNPYDPLHSNPEGRDMAKIVPDIAGSPGDIVLQLLGLVGDVPAHFGVQPKTPDGGLWTANPFSQPVAFADVVTTLESPTRGTIFDPAMLSPGTTPLWSFVDTYGVPQLNEVWVDTTGEEAGPQFDGRNRYSYLHVREKPFVNLTDGENSPWFSLPTRVVHIGEIKSASLRRGDNRYNYLNVLIELPATFAYDAFALCSPVFNTTSIERHGLLKLDMTLALNMLADGETDSLVVAAQIREFRDLVLCWNVLNAYYYSGQLVLQGIRADIRIGQKIVVEGGPIPHMAFGPFTPVSGTYDRDVVGPLDGPFTAYVDRVSYSWAAGSSPEASTTLTI